MPHHPKVALDIKTSRGWTRNVSQEVGFASRASASMSFEMFSEYHTTYLMVFSLICSLIFPGPEDGLMIAKQLMFFPCMFWA
jgi:hypothetical protein